MAVRPYKQNANTLVWLHQQWKAMGVPKGLIKVPSLDLSHMTYYYYQKAIEAAVASVKDHRKETSGINVDKKSIRERSKSEAYTAFNLTLPTRFNLKVGVVPTYRASDRKVSEYSDRVQLHISPAWCMKSLLLQRVLHYQRMGTKAPKTRKPMRFIFNSKHIGGNLYRIDTCWYEKKELQREVGTYMMVDFTHTIYGLGPSVLKAMEEFKKAQHKMVTERLTR